MRIFTTALLMFFAASHVFATDEGLFFESHIRPILKAHCFHCHGEDGEKEGDVDLRQVRLMVDAYAIDSDDPGQSRLLEVVASGEMPIGGKPLPKEDVELIGRWLAGGHPTKRPEPDEVPDFLITDNEQSHWAFQKVVAPEIPKVGQSHPIDAFIVAGLHEAGLPPAPRADRVTLVRRASMDLIGLPPTPEQVAAFVNDNSLDAWPKLIDRLLMSPEYGERWGRHWLDVVGYADSNGGPNDIVRPNAWHYRDYVVASINNDKPWDQFVQEQLAGDELVGVSTASADSPVTDSAIWDSIAATGYLRMGPDPTADEVDNELLAKESVLVDTIRIMGNSLLGLTLQCAQCHDHRFDPVSHVDYHKIRALIEPVYNPSDWRKPDDRSLIANDERELKFNEQIEADADAVDQQRQDLIDQTYAAYLEVRMGDADDSVKAQIRIAWNKPQDDRTEEEVALLDQHDCNFDKADHLRFIPNSNVEETKRVELQERAEAIRGTKVSRVLMVATEVEGSVPATRRFHRGNPLQPKEEVSPGELQVIADAPTIAANDPDLVTTGRRLAYAKWLTCGDHPLVGRVLVNRFWMHHFGSGFVTTAEDFGLRTPRPLHGDLLDHLADWFVRSGWSLKEFHRYVMTSATYQQSARNPAAEAVDASNERLARMSLQRLEAEAVRDSMLSVSRQLVRTIGGPPSIVARNPAGGIILGKELSHASNNVVHTVVPLGEAANRRSLYVQLRRDRTLSVLQAFDMPNMAPNCSERACSTTAPQSLMMLNNTFVIEQSNAMAKRLITEHPNAPEQQLTSLWKLCYGRKPDATVFSMLLEMLVDEIDRQSTFEQTLVITASAAESDPPDDKAEPLSQPRLDPTTRALAAICQVVFASNDFLYRP